jgi:WD40 repeat protein
VQIYDSVRVDDNAPAGKAILTVRYDTWPDVRIAPFQHEVELIREKLKVLPTEPVSKRLVRELQHPDRQETLSNIGFSPGGKRLIAGSYPNNVLQVWDLATGRQLLRFETSKGLRGSSNYSAVAPDWSRLVVWTNWSVRPMAIPSPSTGLYRWNFRDELRIHNLETGAVERTLRHDPPVGVVHCVVSPDFHWALEVGEPSGEARNRPSRKLTVWDLTTGTPVPSELNFFPHFFSKDGRWVVGSHWDDNGANGRVLVVDVGTWKARYDHRIPPDFGIVEPIHLLDGGKTLLLRAVKPVRPMDYSSASAEFQLWDLEAWQLVAAAPASDGKKMYFSTQVSADGRSLIAYTHVTGPRGQALPHEDGEFHIYDVPTMKRRHLVKFTGQHVGWALAISPDSKWAIVPTTAWVTLAKDEKLAEPLQSRLNVVDLATGKIIETMMGPNSYFAQSRFSHDGKLLAMGGLGKVYLWDFSYPPGQPPPGP